MKDQVSLPMAYVLVRNSNIFDGAQDGTSPFNRTFCFDYTWCGLVFFCDSVNNELFLMETFRLEKYVLYCKFLVDN